MNSAYRKIVIEVMQPMFSMTLESGRASFLQSRMFADIVLSFGAGVYEEFIFRLVLVGLVALIVTGLTGLRWTWATLVGVVVSAFVFSAAHHVGQLGEAFTWSAFVFRACSGLFFGVVCYFRGFGIAAGSHAFYDVFYFLYVAQVGDA